MSDSWQQRVESKTPQKDPGLWRNVLTEDDSLVCGLLGEKEKHCRFFTMFGLMVLSHLQPAPVFWDFLRGSVLGHGNMWEWSAFYISAIGGEKKKVCVPPARQRHIAEPCRHPWKGSKLQTTHATSWKPPRMLHWLISLNFTKKYSKKNDDFVLCITLLPPNRGLLVCPRCRACSFKQRPVQPAVGHC